jgi:hypothetical protein
MYMIIKAGMAVALFGGYFAGTATAQTLVPPALADNVWVSGAAVGCGINTAMIDFPAVDSSPNHSEGRLAACAYGNPSGVVLTDINSGFTVNITYPVSGSILMTSCPDVILGNSMLSPTPKQDFIMAVAFVNNNTLPAVEVDYFDIHYLSPGGGPFTVKFNSAQTILMPPIWILLGTVHIDVVAQNSNTSLYGLPLCDHFFVTYDASGNIFATYGSLSAYNALVAGPQRITLVCTQSAPESVQPDVAGVEEGPIGSPYDVARLVYVCENTEYLYYSEWMPSIPGCAGLSTFMQLDGDRGLTLYSPTPV